MQLQTKILLYLPSESIKQARLVCSSWCNLIDTSREFSVIVNDRKFEYTDCQFPPWKIISCLIKYFHAHEECNFLPCPSDLRKLSIWGTISKPNFHRLLNLVPQIEELDLACDFFTSHKDFWTFDNHHQSVKLDHLQKLVMFSNYNIMHHEDNLFGFFRQPVPNLTKLKITMDDPGHNRNVVIRSPAEVKIAIGLAKYISLLKHLKILQISISPIVLSDEIWSADAVEQVHSFPNYESNISKINLQICRLNVSPLYVTLLRPLLRAQSNLKDLRINSPFMEGVPVLYSNIENSLRLSIHALASIQLEWFSGFPAHPMTVLNFELFSHAKVLKRLVLKRFCGFTHGTNGMSKIINFDMIPSTIESLAVEGFICTTEEIKRVALSPSFKLTSVHLIHVGLYGEGVGITGEIVKIFFSSESLQSVSLGPLRNQASDWEDREYTELRGKYLDDRFRSGKVIKIGSLETYRIQQEMKHQETQTEEKRRTICSCFQTTTSP